jgi:TP901 family phage tail tape measure protein
VALSKDVVIRLLGDASGAVAAQKAAADAAEVSVAQYRRAEREMAKQAATAQRMAAEQQAAMASVGRGAMIFGAVIAAGLALAAKAAIDWESAWAGVEKTVDGTPEQMAELEVSLRRLATILPVTHAELAGVAEAAGQLGIAREDIVEFTEVAIAMGVSTNLSAEEAAVGMARLSNIMGTSSSDVDRMGSVLVALGNAGASTEQEILDMGLRIAAAGRQAGMTEGEVLGLANSMSSLGIEAEAGGTAISTVIKDINSSVMDGGDQLERYAEVAGMSAEQFARAWRTDAAGALVTVVEGLGRMQAQGENVNTVIDDLGLGGIRTSDTLLRLAGNAEGLTDSLATGNRAWSENNALMNEANKRYETTASQLAIARNQITSAAIDIGATLLPILAEGAQLVASFVRGWQELPGPLKDVVTILGLLAATVGIVGGAAIIGATKLAAFRTSMTTLAASSGAANAAVGRFGLFMGGPWGAAIGVATLALGGLVTWLGASSQASEESTSRTMDLAAALRDTGGAIDDNIRALRAQAAADREIGDSNLLEIAQKAGVSLPRLTDALVGVGDAYDEVDAALQAYIEENTLSVQSDQGVIVSQNARAKAAAEGRDVLKEMAGETGRAVAENERLAAATEKSGDAAANSTSTVESLAGVTEDLAGSAGDAATAAEQLAEAMDELNGPTLDAREAARGYQEAIDAAAASVAEHGRTLDINTEAGRANQDALDGIAKAAAENANAIAANGGSYDSFRNSLLAGREALVVTAMAMGHSEAEARRLAESIIQIPDAAEVDIALPTYRQVVSQLETVHAKVKGLPPGHTVNVGVISDAAIRALQNVGYTVERLPDGTVKVTANTASAHNDLAAFVSRSWTTTVRARVVYDQQPGRTYYGQIPERAGGGLVGVPGYAGGGSPLPGLALVGERGPELVSFGKQGYVTPADLTRRALEAAQGALATTPAWGGGGGGSSHVDNSRTYNIEVRNEGRPVTAREAFDAAREHEWLHSP